MTEQNKQNDFLKDLEVLINRHSKENSSNTPDFILAAYLNGCLKIFNKTINKRRTWYLGTEYGEDNT